VGGAAAGEQQRNGEHHEGDETTHVALLGL